LVKSWISRLDFVESSGFGRICALANEPVDVPERLLLLLIAQTNQEEHGQDSIGIPREGILHRSLFLKKVVLID
jgi:hypothetical protein